MCHFFAMTSSCMPQAIGLTTITSPIYSPYGAHSQSWATTIQSSWPRSFRASRQSNKNLALQLKRLLTSTKPLNGLHAAQQGGFLCHLTGRMWTRSMPFLHVRISSLRWPLSTATCSSVSALKKVYKHIAESINYASIGLWQRGFLHCFASILIINMRPLLICESRYSLYFGCKDTDFFINCTNRDSI